MAPALSGPTFKSASLSIHAIEPPPAPTAFTSRAGSLRGKPARCRACTVEGSPFAISDTSALVPPMSNVMIFRSSATPARYAAPITPAAGPDNAERIGYRLE